ncbi:Pimeloyl-ACP methyl ester carboxylesterase [Lutibacter agarilyticus]|uniref:Pimeloyl-ACP methyl ester carboxylesterase n=1 Tax=Lutibacter agarilyticus TaxID=1109740 RepID=A0A238XJY3_9FLAO|nr:alpha/beta hydrolase [Lutibacter agarilyticus]SNR58644.1 Pimeloyl-ACP methyl ester carboxylesterase [Lutibacter agarilyticus]
MRKRIYKILKIITIVFLLLVVVLAVFFYRFSQPKSDAYIQKEFKENNAKVFITQKQFKDFKYRVLATQKEIDTTLPSLVFIHGSIGSVLDFKSYLMDSELNKNANLLAYDRVGYGEQQTGEVQESIAFEVELLEDFTKNLKINNTVLVGYSYGGPIVLASKKKYKKVVLLAPAVYSEVEPMPWALNFYKWNSTRWLVPLAWQAASIEKLSHKKDLLNFETHWDSTPSKVLSMHGSKDWIVPYENSLYLNKIFTPNKFELVTLNGAGHGLVWSHFEEIKATILKQLK